eukprot:GEMP01038399.1.p1 GENE.GEMP01038399.1~~GEMP01038399.1.p1  ORF type:complete len:429 (+),score=108.18 GEMP01038399.1:124-1410(+)
MKRPMPVATARREIGSVEQYEKGFGFIISQNPPEGEPSKIFVYHSEIVAKGFRSLKPGMIVSFERSFDQQTQKPCCKDVRNMDGTPINLEEMRQKVVPKAAKEKRPWRNVFQAIPAFRLESYTECSPIATTADAALENEDIPNMGSLFALFRGRFGDEMAKFLKDKLPLYLKQAGSEDDFDITEALTTAFEMVEKEFMEKTLTRRCVDGAEAVACLFEHGLKNGKACVRVYIANVGTCQLIFCSDSGKAVSLNSPHTSTALAIKNQGVEYDQGAAVAGFVDDGIEYRLKSSRVLGARPFKTAKCTLKNTPDVLEGKEWAFKTTDDLFALLVSPEIVEWHGGPQACIDEALDAMRTAQDTGENLTESAAKHLVRQALRKGAPEELSCQCVSFTWMAKVLDKLLDKRKKQKLEGTTEKPVEDDGFDMFAM